MIRERRFTMALAIILGAGLLAGCSDDPTGPGPASVPPRALIVALPGGYTQVSVRHSYSCALRVDGIVECWGVSPQGEVPASRAALTGVFTQVSAGGSHSCALRSDGVVECWGFNGHGRAPPTRPATTGTFTDVSAGGFNTCAVRSDGVIECWGEDIYGQSPATVTPTGGTFTQVSAHNVHACGLRSDGAVQCWGFNDDGRAPPLVTAATGVFTQVSAGFVHTCAVRDDGVVECWGFDSNGQAPPTRTASTGGYTQLSAANLATCALRTDGVVECWGEDIGGSTPPTVTPTSSTFAQMSFSGGHGCATRADGVVECWGHNQSGQAPATRQATTHVLPTATFNAPAGSVNEGLAIALSLTGAQVPGYPSATSFTYAFDCGDGNGYGAFSAASTASCPAADGPSSPTVKGIVQDQDGDTREYSTTVTVANVAPTVLSVSIPSHPVAASGQPVSASATFSDPAGAADESYTCTVDYGDGSGPQAGTIAGTSCMGPDQTYAAAGIYTITVSVTDKDGGTGSLTAQDQVVAYDPDGGFVTGAGWIDSPAGAYVPDATVDGKATFAFVSKYTNGRNTPDGNTRFRLIAAGMTFDSDSYDWLVVAQAGTNAQFKGEGWINGSPDANGAPYKFMLWAGDGQPDTFRMKIWSDDGAGVETMVYDNGFNQSIGAGSVVVHTGKN